MVAGSISFVLTPPEVTIACSIGPALTTESRNCLSVSSSRRRCARVTALALVPPGDLRAADEHGDHAVRDEPRQDIAEIAVVPGLQVPQKARFQLLFVQRRLQIDDKLVTVLFIIPQMGAGRQDHRPGHAPVGKKHFSEVAVDRLFLLILDGQGHIAQGKALHRATATRQRTPGRPRKPSARRSCGRFRGDPVAVAGGAVAG